MCLKQILDFFIQSTATEIVVPPVIETQMPLPTTKKIVDGNYIFNILNKALPTAPHIYISDNYYELCSKEDYQKFLFWDKTNEYIYIPEKFDCDDFTYRVTGNLSIPEWSTIADGTIWTNLHAFKLFIDNTGKLWFMEPQSDALFETWQDYFGNEIQFIEM